VNKVPIWTWAVPAAALVLVVLQHLALPSGLGTVLLALAPLLLGAAVFASVHHAEVIALRVGEPVGSIVLAIAVTVIEVALILSIMLVAKEGSEVLARDTVFATVMLILNGVIGLCLMIGGAHYHEQRFDTNAAAAALSVLSTLAVITLVLPNYTRTVPGPLYAQSQLIFVAVVSIVLYGVFLFIQTIRHRDYFLSVPAHGDDGPHSSVPPTARTALVSTALLCLSLLAVILLAKGLSPSVEAVVEAAGLPKPFVGVVIAAVVLLPEGLAAIVAASKNHLQTSLNLALGSAMATIGLTIPIVSFAAIAFGQRITLGLAPEETTLLLLTLVVGTVTLATGRTTILQGTVHFVIFAVFLFLSAVP
jgi:Ca2+:H+ antiporter